MGQLQTLGFGGGCHWCTEAVFQALDGVAEVEQGFIAGPPPDDTPSEAVRVSFDEARIPLGVLIEVHLRTHASQSDHAMRGRYRSAVYAGTEEDAGRCSAVLTRLASAFEKPLVTRVIRLERFILNDERFLNYRKTRPAAPFCRTHIDPKLALLRRQYGAFVRDGA